MHVTIDSQFSFPEPLVWLPNEPQEFDFQVSLVNAIDLVLDLLPLSWESLIELQNLEARLCHQHSVIVFCTLSEPIILRPLNMIALENPECLPHDINLIYFVSNLVHLPLLDPYIPVHLYTRDALPQHSLIRVLLRQVLQSPLIQAEVNHDPQTKQCLLLIPLLVNVECGFLLDGLQLEF